MIWSGIVQFIYRCEPYRESLNVHFLSFVLKLKVKRMTLTLTTILIIISHLGRGGGASRRHVNFDNPGLENASLFFIFSGLIVHLLTKERHLHNLYEAPPPRYYLCRRGGGCRRQVKTRSKARCIFWTRALHELGYIYCTQ